MLVLLTPLAGCTPTPSPPPERVSISIAPRAPIQSNGSPQDAKFYAFIRDFRPVAIQAGIRPETYDASVAGLRRDPRIEELNRKQPEFIRPVWDYLSVTVSPGRVANGREMLERYGNMLAGLESRYGVPKEILVAIWGIESGYGAEQGSFNMFEALATLAYDGSRVEFARRELVAALRMEEQQHLNPHAMTSSWAGAFGQTQFVPSSFLKYAVDGDGDGRIDLWRSPADALASAAALMHDAGWQMGQFCYREVRLPANFPYEMADAETVKPLAEWSSLGVKAVRGSEIAGDSGSGAIYLPAGARGPSFLVLPNFKALLTYNNAASYALAVCNLADRLRGSGDIIAAWPIDERPLGSGERLTMQSNLKALGYDPGPIDGLLGRKARAALRQYQKDHHLSADGYPTRDMLDRLNADLANQRSATTTISAREIRTGWTARN
ncbi:MAG TPA: lytic murein transglycosylase [Rhizomicrobium sp.]